MAKTSIRDRVRQRARERVEKTSNHINLPNNIGFMKPRMNETMRLDFLLYEVKEDAHPDKIPAGELWYQRPYLVHRNIGAGNASIVCPGSFGKKCPICEERERLIEDGYDKHKDEIKALRPSDRRLFYAIDLKEPDKILLYDVADYKNFPDLLDKEINAGKEEWAAFPDLADGFTLAVRFSSDKIGGGRPFPVADRIDFEKRGAYDEAILDEMPDLGECLVQMSYDQIEKIFLMIDDADIDTDGPPAAETVDGRHPDGGKFRKAAPAQGEPKPPNEEQTPDDNPEGMDGPPCVACGGSGRNSRGGVCRICQGSGTKPVPAEPEPAPNPAPAKRVPPRKNAPTEQAPAPSPTPARRSAARKEPAPEPEKNKCPAGHVWGKDCEKFDDCTETSICNDASWAACKDESERLAKK